ncbi:MAG: CDP-archaeol synthase, partial [Alcaligenaceae bacterium]|nr:CDP-archaeol synthase [Alcaligenaceae bacterium]
ATDVKTIESVVSVGTWSLFDIVVFVFSVVATLIWMIWVPIQLIFFRHYAQTKVEVSEEVEQVLDENLSTEEASKEDATQVPKKAMQWVTFATPMVLLFIFWLGSIYLLYVKGPWALLSLWVLVWLADTGAYFGGSYLGGPKLAPNVSPNKTISGALCGLISGVLWCVVSYYLPYSFMSYIHSPNALFVILLLGVVLTVVSILGDLYESHIKRIADVKDSSGLLPGHGGIWDRLDSIIAVTPVALLALLWFI